MMEYKILIKKDDCCWKHTHKGFKKTSKRIKRKTIRKFFKEVVRNEYI